VEENRVENCKDIFVDFLNQYNECFYNKDIVSLKDFYDVQSNVLVYFDNHKSNDTYTLDEHLKLISDFFVNGKLTESGSVEPVIIEDLTIFHKESTACLCFISKYKSFPISVVRSTLYLERINGKWKILHAHFSFQPEK